MSILQQFSSDGGFVTTGNVNAANVVAQYLFGDGSNITGITVSGGNEILNGTSNVIIPTANGNINFNTADGLGNTWQWVMDVNGNLVLPPNNNKSSITTATGTNNSITIHPDGTGRVNIKGDATPMLTVYSDTENNSMQMVIQAFGNSLAGSGGGTYVGQYLRPGTPLIAGDRLAALSGKGSYDGVNYISSAAGRVQIMAANTWSSTSTPTYVSIFNTPEGSTAQVENMRINPNGNVNIYNGNIISQGAYITGNSDTGSNAFYAGVPGFTQLISNVLAQFTANVNSYGQINFQNISSGSAASTDFILETDNSTEYTHFFDIGITSSTWDGSQTNSLGTALAPNDGYIWNQDGNVKIATTVGNAAPSLWKFDTVGNLTLPGNTFAVNYANGTPVALGGGGNTGNFAFGPYTLDSTDFDEIYLTGTNSGNILITADGLAMLAAGYESDGVAAGGGNVYLFTGDPTFVDGLPQPGYAGGPPGRVLQFNDYGNVILPAQNVNAGAGSGEAVKFYGTRRIVNGATNAYNYSTVLAAGGTPTVAYSATDSTVQSVRVTFAVQGANQQWEQFDVVATLSITTPGDVDLVVSNRIKANTAIPDTVVTAAQGGSDQITISLNLDVSQSAGWASFDAVEFGLMAG